VGAFIIIIIILTLFLQQLQLLYARVIGYNEQHDAALCAL
jgi:hypothetical protein